MFATSQQRFKVTLTTILAARVNFCLRGFAKLTLLSVQLRLRLRCLSSSVAVPETKPMTCPMETRLLHLYNSPKLKLIEYIIKRFRFLSVQRPAGKQRHRSGPPRPPPLTLRASSSGGAARASKFSSCGRCSGKRSSIQKPKRVLNASRNVISQISNLKSRHQLLRFVYPESSPAWQHSTTLLLLLQ